MPDIAIIQQFRRLRPEIDIRVVSYGSGAEAFRMLGEPVLDVGADDSSSAIDLIVPLGRALVASHEDLIISHEEPIILPLAHLTRQNTVFLTHWFTGPSDPFIDALSYADHVIFMEKEGIFPEPQKIRGKVRYVGPVLRDLQVSQDDRPRIRADLGLKPEDHVILVAPGHFSTADAAACSRMIVHAFRRSQLPSKKLVWILNGIERALVDDLIEEKDEISVYEPMQHIERLMIACDVAITKGTYNTTMELFALGIPTISLSSGLNFVDDFFARRIASNIFLWMAEVTEESLANTIDTVAYAGATAGDQQLLGAAGARRVACILDELLPQ